MKAVYLTSKSYMKIGLSYPFRPRPSSPGNGSGSGICAVILKNYAPTDGLIPSQFMARAFHFRALLSAIEKAAAMFCSFIVQPLSRYISFAKL
jgi:hypothetical protein